MLNILHLEWPHYLSWIVENEILKLLNVFRSYQWQQEAVSGTLSVRKSIPMSENVSNSFFQLFHT